MNEKKLYSKLKKIVEMPDLSDIEEKIVFRDPDGDYQLFGKYTISKKKEGYLVTKKHTFVAETFGELKHAVVWSTLDKLNKVYDSNRVIELDRLLISTEAHIELHRKLSKKAKDLNSYELFLSKTQEDQEKKAKFLYEMGKYVADTKSWQNKAFRQAAK